MHSAFSESFRREIYSGTQKAVNISVVVMVTAFQFFDVPMVMSQVNLSREEEEAIIRAAIVFSAD